MTRYKERIKTQLKIHTPNPNESALFLFAKHKYCDIKKIKNYENIKILFCRIHYPVKQILSTFHVSSVNT